MKLLFILFLFMILVACSCATQTVRVFNCSYIGYGLYDCEVYHGTLGKEDK
jgi:hypothetical protein